MLNGTIEEQRPSLLDLGINPSSQMKRYHVVKIKTFLGLIAIDQGWYIATLTLTTYLIIKDIF